MLLESVWFGWIQYSIWSIYFLLHSLCKDKTSHHCLSFSVLDSCQLWPVHGTPHNLEYSMIVWTTTSYYESERRKEVVPEIYIWTFQSKFVKNALYCQHKYWHSGGKHHLQQDPTWGGCKSLSSQVGAQIMPHQHWWPKLCKQCAICSDW